MHPSSQDCTQGLDQLRAFLLCQGKVHHMQAASAAAAAKAHSAVLALLAHYIMASSGCGNESICRL